jgi:hypothetical protein
LYVGNGQTSGRRIACIATNSARTTRQPKRSEERQANEGTNGRAGEIQSFALTERTYICLSICAHSGLRAGAAPEQGAECAEEAARTYP